MKDFPLTQKIVYLDSAATSLKPRQVINTMNKYYRNYTANVHRGIHKLSQKSTQEYEKARQKIAKFINAKPTEIIFVRNATEGINLVAQTIGKTLTKNDLILLTEMEHHSNIVPWQQLNTQLAYIPITKEGYLAPHENYLNSKNPPKIFAFTHVSNVLGTINPAKELIQIARKTGAITLLDASQSIPHLKIDVKELDCDFIVFSGHKMLGPTGIGVLYGREELLNKMQPFLTGGDMIKEVTWQKTTFNELPWKFEAGTPPIAEAIGLGAAVDYLQKHMINEHELLSYAIKKISEVKGVKIYGPSKPEDRCGVISFNLGDMHAHDVATILDSQGIAIRSGHHCCMPLMKKLDVPATCRASFYLYNTKEDVDKLCAALEHARKVFKL